LTARVPNTYRAAFPDDPDAERPTMPAFKRTMREILARGGVMPILTVADASLAGDLARALVRGGVLTFEVVLRTPAAIDALKAMIAAAPEASIGLGTILNARARAAGAAFGVSPGTTPELAGAVREAGFPFIPGVSSVSEAMYARQSGFGELKLFPANVVGGVAWLQAVAPVFPDLVFCPTGGIRPPEIPTYLAQPNCMTVGGSWVVPKDALAARDWPAIEALARQAAGFKRG
jgi:2-dehydro-3-deoxyphosphogluconate aldolase/(4S)-4-hydroxy-2-oxoglutarate aldolase